MNWEQIAIGVLLLAHGVGHVVGILPALGMRGEGWHARSWLLTPRLGARPAAAVSAVLWTVSALGFIGVGAAVLGWLPLRPAAGAWAVALAWLSTTTLLLYWHAFPALVPNKVGALAVNLAIVWAVWVEGWPTEGMLAG